MSDTPSGIDLRKQAFIRAELDLVIRHIKTLDALRALTLGAAAGLLYLLGVVIADHVADTGLSLALRRGLLTLVGLAAVAGMMVFVLRPMVWRINDIYAAWLIEQRFPKLQQTLITTLEVQRDSHANTGVVAGLINRAARQLARRDVLVSLPTRGLTRALVAVGVVAAAFLAYVAVAPKAVLPSLVRALGADVPAPTCTRLEWLVPASDISVIRGTPVEFEGRTFGRTPSEAWIEFSADAGKSWNAQQRLVLRPPQAKTEPTWRATQPGPDVQSSVLCRMVAGDAVSDSRRLEVRPAPTEAGVIIHYRYPEYTGLAPRTDNGPDIDALVGTRIELGVRANVPVRSGVIHYETLDGAAARQMEHDSSDPARMNAAWTVDTDEEFRVSLRDHYGIINARPILHRQRARADAPPIIQLARPGEDLELSQNGRMELSALVSDDFGLSDVAISYRNGGASGRLPLAVSRGAREVQIQRHLAVSAFAAEPGDIIEWNLVAVDNRRDLRHEPAYQTTVGPTRRIRIRADSAQLASRSEKQPDPQPHGGGRNDPQASSGGNTTDETGASGAQGDRPSDASERTQTSQAGDSGTDDLFQRDRIERLVEKLGHGPAEPDKSADKPAQTGSESSPEQEQSGQRSNDQQSDQNSQARGDQETGTGGNGNRDGSNNPNEGRGASQQGQDAGAQARSGDKQEGSSKSGSANSTGAGGDHEGGSESGAGNKSGSDEKSGAADRGGDSTGKPAAGGGQSAESGEPNDPSQSASGQGPGSSATDDSRKGSGQDASSGNQSGQKSDGANPGSAGAKSGSSGGEGSRDGGESRKGPGGSESRQTDGPGHSGSNKSGQAQSKASSSGQSGNSEGTGNKPGSGGNGPVGGKSDPQRSDEPMREKGEFRPESRTGRLPVDVNRLQRAVNELERLQREGKLDPALLAELGWTQAQAAEFIKEYRRRSALTRGDPAARGHRASEIGPGAGPGDQRVQPGDNGGGIFSGTSASGSGRGAAPALQSAAPEDVPVEYRDLLDAYYRTMARDAASPQSSAPASAP